MDLNTSASKLRFVGPTYASRLQNLGVFTLKDLLYHFPFRYEDLSQIAKIDGLQIGETATVTASIWQIKNIRTRTGKFLTNALINDGSGSLEVVWFNQPFLTKTLKTGMSVTFSGKVSTFNRKLSLVSPGYEVVRGTESIHTGRLVPVYPETAGVSSKWLRSRIKPLLTEFLDQVPEILPEEIVRTHGLLPVKEALRLIHFPQTSEDILQARKRFGFEELFIVQMRAEMTKRAWQKQNLGAKFDIHELKIKEFIAKLPFELTGAQKRSVEEILADLSKPIPMNRLLEGDVGSGKTVVAAIASYATYLNGYRSVLMAPTEILATQHFQTLTDLLESWGLKVLLQTGSKKMLKKGTDFDLVVGTHALLVDQLSLPDLGLVVIDEQHRFGVEQRSLLRSRGKLCHFLTMTATPIPRTMALTLYGDLDLSVIDEMPQGRQVIKTYLVAPDKRDGAYTFIREHALAGEKTFIIAPFIEPSDSLSSVRAVNTEFKRLSEEVFPDLKIGLLHGRLKAREKDEVLTKFRRGEYQILVSTPVVEVGIDIPQATIMMIEGADRFGLAQIHQLRGRVGRGQKQSFCLLFTDNTTTETLERLKLMEKYQIGMQVAEADLKTRGPGQVFGTAQSGLLGLKVANLTDIELIQDSKQAATSFLSKDPSLKDHPLILQELQKLDQKVTPD